VTTAVSYLRVSTSAQADTDEKDPEGYSIPAQREACRRKAESFDATIVEEYIDRGESARRADRPALGALLERVKAGDIAYVIVHKVDRLARNRADDVTIGLTFKAAGVRLVSCTENIDETPSGRLLHGIMASIAEFYSANLSTEIIKGSTQKAKSGGTPTMAPLGYLNVREHVDGREVRTVRTDPERGPLMRYAFEAYATGDYSLRDLLELLTEMGLRYRATPKRPERTVRLSQLCSLLHNPYYIGVVSYRGEHYLGRHEPLVDGATFKKVQDLLDAHRNGGERSWMHDHYLKGSLFCHRCGSRLSLTMAKGNGGTYPYFYCLGRTTKRTECNLPWLPVELVEEAVERFYLVGDRREIAPDGWKVVGGGLERDLAELDVFGQAELVRQQAVVADTQRRRAALAAKSEAGVIPDDLARQRQNDLAIELASAISFLAKLESAVIDTRAILRLAIELLDARGLAYTAAVPTLRRQWNQTLYKRLLVDVEGVKEAEMTEAFEAITRPETVDYYRTSPDPWQPTDEELRTVLAAWGPEKEKTGPVFVGSGLNVELLVEVSGLEPPTSALRTLRSAN
jgi:site-specific DNA recombinase